MNAKLILDDKTLELPTLEGTEKERAVDIGALRAKTGYITLDPGFMNTGSCRSAITFVDGEKGILRYRGYPIEELAEKSTFLETAYLLMNGELPSKAELEQFSAGIIEHTMLHENVKQFFGGFRRGSHPMAVTAAVLGALSTFYADKLNPKNEKYVQQVAALLIAKFPTIASYAYKHLMGQPFMYPKNSLDYSANLLHMMFATPCEDYQVDPIVAKALDLLFILHADHEQNCSTSTVRMVGSSGVNLFVSVSAGVHALWGPLHGGANQAVVEMLEQIAATGDSGKAFLAKVKDKSTDIRLMGFGHRVYKNFDPRAKILKKACFNVLNRLKRSSRLLDLAVELEDMALKDSYFVERKLYPNVDFYSGIIYQALDIPVPMFPVMFAMGRLPGWAAHFMEMQKDAELRIARPRQIYTGPNERDYVPIAKRG